MCCFYNLNLFQLAGTNRPIALARANAVLSRIDLVCEVIVMCGCVVFPPLAISFILFKL